MNFISREKRQVRKTDYSIFESKAFVIICVICG